MTSSPVYLLGLVMVMVLGANAPAASQSHSRRPNIVLILSDDMGYSDLGCYGSEIKTPNLDSLAKAGLRYTHFYNQARCCPTRASLMTGLYPHQAGMGWMDAVDHQLPGYQGQLNERCITIPQVLKSAGYRTYMAGKWHLQREQDARPDGENHNWPRQRGFDRFYGILKGGGSYYDPATLCRDNRIITPLNDPEYRPKSYYFTDAISDNAVRFIQEHPADEPFFLYVAYTAAHWPMQAPEGALEKYRGKYDAGWEAIRLQRVNNMKQWGVIAPHAILSPLDAIPWHQEPDKKAMARRMEVYAAMVDMMDQGIGRIVAELKRRRMFENTLLLFLEDNGGNAEGIGFGGPEGQTRPVGNDKDARAPGIDEVQLNVIPAFTRDGRPVMAGKQVMAGPPDTYLAYLKPWAQVSNTPFRRYKHYVHEGGIATPLIAHWPAGIKEKGGLRSQAANVIDIMPTLVELCGASYPKLWNGNPVVPMAGVSLVPTFTNNRPLNRTALFWEHEMNRAVRMGKWKLVSSGDLLDGGYGRWKYYRTGPWELYDLEKDPSELTDVSGEHPQQAEQMAKMWQVWTKTVPVYPTPWAAREPIRPAYVAPLH